MVRRNRGGSWLRLVLGAVYSVMALGQLASLPRMPAILSAHGLSEDTLALSVALVLIAGELLCGAWFLARPRSRAATQVVACTAVSAAWSVLAVQAFTRGLSVPDCGCCGSYLPQHLSGITLPRTR